jgi:hypothetical protein
VLVRFRNLLLGLGVATSCLATSQENIFLRAKHSGKCAQVNGASTANGIAVSQWDCLDQSNVKWSWIEVDNGYVFLKAQHSNKCAQVDGASPANGAKISQWDCVNQDNVKWALKPVGSSNGSKYYNIVNKATGKCMQVEGAANANGAKISQWDCVDQDNLKWALPLAPVVRGGKGNLSNDNEGWDTNGFGLSVSRSQSLTDLIFEWKCRSKHYDTFNVRVRISDGREGQVEVAGGSDGSYRERNASVGLIYVFMVQGCDKGTLGSTCSSWSQFSPFKNDGRNGR